MEVKSFCQPSNFKTDKPDISVILETPFSKEIKIVMLEGQQMKEHKTPFPIVIHVIQGELDFGVHQKFYHLKQGDIFFLEGGIPHQLTALTHCVVRLTLSQMDSADRVKKVVQSS